MARSAEIRPMAPDLLDEVTANVAILIAEEMEVRHRLGGHPVPVPDCPICISRGGARP
jgi:hypothetical protein